MDEWDEDPDDFLNYRHQRRLSDPSANLNNYSRYGWKTKGTGCGEQSSKARSENEGLDSLASEVSEIEAGDLKDGKRYTHTQTRIQPLAAHLRFHSIIMLHCRIWLIFISKRISIAPNAISFVFDISANYLLFRHDIEKERKKNPRQRKFESKNNFVLICFCFISCERFVPTRRTVRCRYSLLHAVNEFTMRKPVDR